MFNKTMERHTARIRQIWTPQMYHGFGRTRRFFQGWYYKLVNDDQSVSLALIPGVFLGQNPADSHAFLQILEGETGKTTYLPFPLAEFGPSLHGQDLTLGLNHFGEGGIRLNLAREAATLSGELTFRQTHPWPSSFLSPGIMGPFAWVPFLQCYHGVLSMDHNIEGTLVINGKTISFDRGRGYTETDWGQSFPRSWIWMASNHFKPSSASLTVSIATIPWLGRAFRGLIAGFLLARKLYRFTTYNGGTLESLSVSDKEVAFSLSNRHYRLEVQAQRSEGGILHAPYRSMEARVTESLTAAVHVRLSEFRSSRLVFAGRGTSAGLEINGDLRGIIS
jgi:tocopherol cyclase